MNEEKSQNPKTTEQQTDLEEQYKELLEEEKQKEKKRTIILIIICLLLLFLAVFGATFAYVRMNGIGGGGNKCTLNCDLDGDGK